MNDRWQHNSSQLLLPSLAGAISSDDVPPFSALMDRTWERRSQSFRSNTRQRYAAHVPSSHASCSTSPDERLRLDVLPMGRMPYTLLENRHMLGQCGREDYSFGAPKGHSNTGAAGQGSFPSEMHRYVHPYTGRDQLEYLTKGRKPQFPELVTEYSGYSGHSERNRDQSQSPQAADSHTQDRRDLLAREAPPPALSTQSLLDARFEPR